LLCAVGCPGGLPNPANKTISFNIVNGISRNAADIEDRTIAITQVVIRNNQTDVEETHNLSRDRIVYDETRGFCCFIPGIYTVTLFDGIGRVVSESNILTGEGVKLVTVFASANAMLPSHTVIDPP